MSHRSSWDGAPFITSPSPCFVVGHLLLFDAEIRSCSVGETTVTSLAYRFVVAIDSDGDLNVQLLRGLEVFDLSLGVRRQWCRKGTATKQMSCQNSFDGWDSTSSLPAVALRPSIVGVSLELESLCLLCPPQTKPSQLCGRGAMPPNGISMALMLARADVRRRCL